MANTKEIQRRIKSINNTKKITKAMEMVAASKMRRAVEAVLKTRTYANLSWTTILQLSQAVDFSKEQHPLFTNRQEIKKVGIILITSNRGLCGGFNSALMNKVHNSILKKQYKDNKMIIDTDFIVVGKKGLSIHSRYKYNIVAEFPKLDICSEVEEVRPMAKLVMEGFLDKTYDKILVAYTDFVNAAKQEARVKQLLPIDINAVDDHLGIVGKDTRLGVSKDFIQKKEDKYLKSEKESEFTGKRDSFVFTFEPSPDAVLNQMVPRLIEVQLFQALLESNASEHSARMAAMHQANEAAGDLLKQLTLYYNKARQAAITAEIAEISAGAEALNA